MRILPENQVSLARSTPNPLDKVHLISASVEVGKTLSGLSVGGEGISATVQSFSIIGSENGREDGARALFDWKPMEPTTCMASPSQTAELQVEDWLSVRPSRENARLESERSHRGENRLLVRTSQLQSEWSLVSVCGIDRYVYERVRDFHARRPKVAGRGTHRFSVDVRLSCRKRALLTSSSSTRSRSKERLGDIAISGGYSSSVRRPLFDKPGSIRKSIPGL